MADLAASDVTITVETRPPGVGLSHNNEVKIAFGDGAKTYPAGGVPLPSYSSFGLVRELRHLDLTDANDASGIQWKFDKENLKLRGWQTATVTPAGTNSAPAFTGTAPASPLVISEAVTVTSHVGTLANVPAYIIAVHVTAGGVTGAFKVIPVGETPLTKQAAVSFVTGAMTFVASDAVTAASVTYMPQRAGTPFSSANLVIDESIIAAAAKTTLANRAFAVQYVWDDTDGVLDVLEPVGEAPSATHKAVIDILNGASTTDIDFHADDEGNTVKVTYLKYSGLDATTMFVNDDDITLVSEAYSFTEDGDYHGLVIPGYGCVAVGEEAGATNHETVWEGPSGTAANAVSTWSPVKNYILTNDDVAIVTLSMPWFVYSPEWSGDATPAGTVAAPTFTGAATTAAALSEITGAVAAQVLYGIATGW